MEIGLWLNLFCFLRAVHALQQVPAGQIVGPVWHEPVVEEQLQIVRPKAGGVVGAACSKRGREGEREKERKGLAKIGFV